VEAAVRPSFAAASRDLLRETVLDAVGRLAAERPWSEVKMADVAEAAGVSRQTLYNSFGSRQEMAQAYVLREADNFLVAVTAAVHANAPDARAALRGALEIFLTAAETHPVIRSVVASDAVGDELLPLLTTRGGPLVTEITDRLAELFTQIWSGVPEPDIRMVADTLVRLAISHAALPSAPPAQTAEDVAQVLGPAIDERLAAARAAS